MEYDYGYPFGIVNCDNPSNLKEISASCPACDDEVQDGHFQCVPGWNSGGKVIHDPILTDSGWLVLIEK